MSIGRISLWTPDADGRQVRRAQSRNLVLAGLGFASARALGIGDRAYKINTVYVEFENTGSAISNPTVTGVSGRSYYTGLLAPKGYLRVPIVGTPRLFTAAGYEGLYGADEGNALEFFATTDGRPAENGVTFSSGAGSKVYGLGLVVAPDEDDPSRDIVVARGYFSPSNHMAKPASSEVTVSWELELTPTA